MSLDDSREMIRVLGVRYDEIPIAPAMDVYATMLDPLFAGMPADTTEENIQARIRGNILMALSNKTGALVLTTGNKSEMAVGYCTLYGDMAGGFAVIKDVYKTLVYRLSRYRNTLCGNGPLVIPENIIASPVG
jgi:NAD+ synthase/NAD+ synthase (glutamine-hydrolysing)